MIRSEARRQTPAEKACLAAFRALDAAGQRSLLDFAAFLQSRQPPAAPPAEPAVAPRPEQETVVAAIRRLTAGYGGVNTDLLLHDVSGLMSQHMLQGRAAGEVIDDLEALFAREHARQAAKAGA
jgi:hypothetical protein